MRKETITLKSIESFKTELIEEEKSTATINKYIRDIQTFYNYLQEDKTITKECVVSYKLKLAKEYRPRSVNSMLVALNRFFVFLNIPECQVKLNKIQKSVFGDDNKEMTKEEYKRLLFAAKSKNNERLYMIIQTICATGIRVSEHKYITVDALKKGRAVIINKGKVREIILPIELKRLLLNYCKKQNIKCGPIFVTKGGKPMDRSNIWSSMKSLCEDARVDSQKVFPHNLRHLFAITYYQLEKDLDTLASLLGHTSIDTTRIYTMKSGKNCLRSLSKMNLCIND